MANSKRRPSKTGANGGGKASARRVLERIFAERGYLRAPDPQRRESMGSNYKKGYEVRLGVSTRKEVVEVKKALRQVGLNPGRDYKHHNDYVVPLYGRDAVDWFRSLGGSTGP